MKEIYSFSSMYFFPYNIDEITDKHVKKDISSYTNEYLNTWDIYSSNSKKNDEGVSNNKMPNIHE